jgi:hypothetical protein
LVQIQPPPPKKVQFRGHFLVSVAQQFGVQFLFARDLPGRLSRALHRCVSPKVDTEGHEIGHVLLREQFDNRALVELETESTAYVICKSLNLDTSDYSFGFVAGWAGGGEQATPGIKGSCVRIQKAAASVLQSFEVEQEHAA